MPFPPNYSAASGEPTAHGGAQVAGPPHCEFLTIPAPVAGVNRSQDNPPAGDLRDEPESHKK